MSSTDILKHYDDEHYISTTTFVQHNQQLQ